MDSNDPSLKMMEITPYLLIRNFLVSEVMLAFIYILLRYPLFRILILAASAIQIIVYLLLFIKIFKRTLGDKDRTLYMIISNCTLAFIFSFSLLYSLLRTFSFVFSMIFIISSYLATLTLSFILARKIISSNNLVFATRRAIRHLALLAGAEIVFLLMVTFGLSILFVFLLFILRTSSLFVYTFTFYSAVYIVVYCLASRPSS